MLRRLRFALFCAAGGALVSCHKSASTPAATTGAGAAAKPRGPAVAVVLGQAQRRDTPIYLDGIGTVSAFNSVTIRSQVDGQLQRIAFREGQDVKAGDLLAVVDPRPYKAALDQAKAKKAEDEAQSANATATYGRTLTLGQKGLVGQQSVDTDRATEAQMKALVQADDAAIEQSAVQLGYTEIKAPFDGRIGLRLVDIGNVVHANDVNGIVMLTQLKPISVIFTLPQQNWPQVQELMNQGAKLKVEAVGDLDRSLGLGELSYADNQIDAATGTIRLKATFPNTKLSLWPGQFVNVRLLLETRAGAVVVPSSVVQRGPQGTYAFVVKADSTVEMRPVQVGQIDGGWAVIESGMKAGEKVVVDGQYKLQPGTLVAAAVPAGGAADGKKSKASAAKKS
jgi:multidrug efflux system membrane fusion protein